MNFSAIKLKLFIIVLFLFASSNAIAKKSYSIEQIQINAELLADGSLKIEESRTYKFRGRFRWADYKLPLDKVGVIKDFTLRENSQLFDHNSSEEPGTFVIESNEDRFYVKWFYKARSETRTFILNYTITDVATIYDDIAELYIKFIGEANPKTVGDVDITLKLPQPINMTQVQAWAHGPLWGEIHFENGLLKMSVSPFPKRTFWEARVLLPTEWVSASTKIKAGRVLQAIVAEEAELARLANEARKKEIARHEQRRENARKAWPIALALAGLSFGFLGFLYLKSGRGFDVSYPNKIDSAIPDDLPPTLASYVYYQKQVHGGALMATLLNLARRGFIQIEQQSADPFGRKKKSRKDKFTITLKNSQWQGADDLADYEKSLLSLVFDDLGQGQASVDFDKFKKNRSKVHKWFMKWRKLIKAHFEGKPYWDSSSVKGVVTAAIISFCVVMLGILMAIVAGTPGVLPTVAGVFCFGLSFAILRYTPEIKLIRKKLAALRNYIKKYHFVTSDSGSFLGNIQEYLVYAVALGVGKKPIAKLIGTVPENKHAVYFPWYLGHPGYMADGDFTGALTSFVSTATTTMSSTTGAGGGASVGGGAGAGGAAGGAG